MSHSKKSATTPQDLIPEQDKARKEASFATPAYNQAARNAKLGSLALSNSKFSVQPEFYAAGEKDGETLNLSYASEVSHETFNASEGVASCEWTWSVHAKIGRKTALSIAATYVVIYTDLKECEQDAVYAYMRRVGRFATYPYFRAHVSQLSWESAANLPILPTIAT